MDRTQRNLAVFSAVAVGCGWVGVGLATLLGIPSDTPSGSPGLLIFIVTPMLTGLALRGLDNDGWNNTGFRLRLRGNLGWYTLSILVFPIVTAINVAIGIAAGCLTAPATMRCSNVSPRWEFALKPPLQRTSTAATAPPSARHRPKKPATTVCVWGGF